MAASRQLHPPLRAATMETIVGLLAVSELRGGEVIRLTNSDVDFEQDSLVVRDSKSGKSRAVPLHVRIAHKKPLSLFGIWRRSG